MAQKHPAGLYRLFFTEMWERLAFYTMLNILLLYTTDSERGGLGLTSAEGNEIYGLYLAFVYFTPFPGGMLADRYLGYRKAVFIGAVFMSGGLFLMSIPGSTYFITGLVGLIVGNGFFKPNISVMVGNLYEAGDPKRDAGFNIFYMGINIGAFVASFLSSAADSGVKLMRILKRTWSLRTMKPSFVMYSPRSCIKRFLALWSIGPRIMGRSSERSDNSSKVALYDS